METRCIDVLKRTDTILPGLKGITEYLVIDDWQKLPSVQALSISGLILV
jgi:hypothetical protein